MDNTFDSISDIDDAFDSFLTRTRADKLRCLESAKEYREQGDHELYIRNNKQRAFDYYALGEKDWGDEYCRYQLALMHLEGIYAHPSIDRFEEAIRLLIQNAKKGHWESCHKLGEIYCNEDYGHKNLDEALVWFHQAAENDDNYIGARKTCFNVGSFFKEGVFFEKDYKQALTWYEEAVELGHIDSLYFIATIYHKGSFGVQQDLGEAIKYYINAAVNEDDCTYYAEAANTLGEMYRDGEGVEVDYIEALKWFERSVQSENPSQEGEFNLAAMHSQGFLGSEADLELAKIWAGMADKGDK